MFLGDHGEVEVVSLCGVVCVHGAQQVNELRDTKSMSEEVGAVFQAPHFLCQAFRVSFRNGEYDAVLHNRQLCAAPSCKDTENNRTMYYTTLLPTFT